MSFPVCPSCRAIVSPEMQFCPACGKPLRASSAETSVARQALVYGVSILLPPFGFWYAWKYIRRGDRKAKVIGWVAAALTIVSIVANVWIMAGYLEQFKQSLGIVDMSAY